MTDENDLPLAIRSLRTGYGDIAVVWDVSLDVKSGSVTGLLGRNGTGKTTTLRAVAGLLKATQGKVLLGGVDVTTLEAHKRVKAGLAYVQEGKRIFRQRTVLENLHIGGRSCGLRKPEMADRVDEACARFPALGPRLGETAGVLSGGQQQMLSIAQALMRRPRVLMLDEPSAGLSPALVGDMVETITSLRDEGMSILLVEQSVDFAVAVADRVVVLDLGRVVAQADGGPGAKGIIEKAYFGGEIE